VTGGAARAAGSGAYRDYIRPADLQRALRPAGRSADEMFALAGLASAALWWRLRQEDLAILASLRASGRAASPKILSRVGVIDGLLDQHVRLLRRAAADERTIALIRGLPRTASREPHAARLRGAVGSLVDVDTLFGAAGITLEAYHRQSRAQAGPDDVNDALTFVTSHQAPECWFLAMTAVTDELCSELRAGSFGCAAKLARRVAGIMGLFAESIGVPLTITSQSYLRFRHELCSDSGTSSEQFRACELALLRDGGYVARLEEYGLLTDRLRQVLARPTVSEELMARLAREAVICAGEPVAAQAAQLARALDSPVPARLRGLHAVVRGITGIEQSWAAWRVNHLDMVVTMIGRNRPALGLGGCPPGRHQLGVPFLEPTLGWAMFPVLRELRELREPRDPRGAGLCSRTWAATARGWPWLSRTTGPAGNPSCRWPPRSSGGHAGLRSSTGAIRVPSGATTISSWSAPCGPTAGTRTGSWPGWTRCLARSR
jgi:tryptophan 2,3-dioxygenase